jgi:hypothetical protein
MSITIEELAARLTAEAERRGSASTRSLTSWPTGSMIRCV